MPGTMTGIRTQRWRTQRKLHLAGKYNTVASTR